MTVRKKALVSGRVQGVFFRDECRRHSEREGVAGSARNLPDGRVEAIFEGEEAAVDRLIEWCRQGPSHAHVDDVEIVDEDPVGATGFNVG